MIKIKELKQGSEDFHKLSLSSRPWIDY
jgi:hypothetical protein